MSQGLGLQGRTKRGKSFFFLCTRSMWWKDRGRTWVSIERFGRFISLGVLERKGSLFRESPLGGVYLLGP